MGDLGNLTLWLALGLSSYSMVGSVLGKLFSINPLLESARKTVYVLVLVVGVATASLVASFITRDFEIS